MASRADDGPQPAFGLQRHGVARFGARVGLLVSERVRHRIRNVLDERAAQRHIHQLLAAANAERGHRPPVRGAGDGKLEGGAAVLGGDGLVPCRGAEEGGVHVEGAAGDDEAVHRLQIALRKLRLVRQCDRNPAGRRDRGAVVLADRIPGLARIAAGRLGIEREADDGLSHAPTVGAPPAGRNQRPARWAAAATTHRFRP